MICPWFQELGKLEVGVTGVCVAGETLVVKVGMAGAVGIAVLVGRAGAGQWINKASTTTITRMIPTPISQGRNRGMRLACSSDI